MYGVYDIGCNQKYIGKTKSPIRTWTKEHKAHIRFDRNDKFSIAKPGPQATMV